MIIIKLLSIVESWLRVLYYAHNILLCYNITVSSTFLHHKNQQRFGLFLIAIWLLFLLSHTAHSETLSHHDEVVHCQLCYGNVDNTNEIDIKLVPVQRIFHYETLSAQPSALLFAFFYQPQLRAPPY